MAGRDKHPLAGLHWPGLVWEADSRPVATLLSFAPSCSLLQAGLGTVPTRSRPVSVGDWEADHLAGGEPSMVPERTLIVGELIGAFRSALFLLLPVTDKVWSR